MACKKNGAMLRVLTMRSPIWFLLLAAASTSLVLVQYFFYSILFKGTIDNVQIKYILYWTKMFGQSDFNLGFGRKIFENCSVNNCYATDNKTYLPVDQFDAILFHAIESMDSDEVPDRRSPNQYYVYSNQESPIHTPDMFINNNFFNWTMTYRLDSDIIRPYGYYEKANTNYEPPFKKKIGEKPYKIAWLVSNCMAYSNRQLLYKKISKYIDVDVYGSCGNRTCSKEHPDECYRFLEENYKFYLSFENSICQDYASEKLYNVLKWNLIPIVYGGGDYHKIAPPRSVIDVRKFKSIKDLAEYVQVLDKNPDEYLTYFEWKKKYSVETDNKLTLCRLCEKLNEPIVHKTYSDINKWWKRRNICKLGQSILNLLFA